MTRNIEPWLRGPLDGVPAELQPAAHAFVHVREEIERLTAGLTRERCWTRPGSAASIGWHLRHLAGSTDRLLTYAREEPLDPSQRAALVAEREDTPDVEPDALVQELVAVLDRALAQLRATPASVLDSPRAVGRAGLPSTVRGLLFHAAEHAARHTGQIATSRLALED